MKDFFVSYSSADHPWAEWIAWVLEEVGYTTVLEAWDVRPGHNLVLEMNRAAQEAKQTLALLSPAYLAAPSTQAQWAVAFQQDPTGWSGRLIPVRIAACEVAGLLGSIVPIELADLDQVTARQSLLEGLRQERRRPAVAPSFPGPVPTAKRTVPARPHFPGAVPASPFSSDYQHHVVYNFHRPELLEQAAALLGTDAGDQPSILLLCGERGIGRSYFLSAVAYRLQQANKNIRVVDLDLSGYEPGTTTLQAFVNHQLARSGRSHPPRSAVITELFPKASLEARATLFQCFWASVILKLELPLSKQGTAAQADLDIVGHPRRERDSFHRLLERLCEPGLLVLHIVDRFQLPVTLREWLLDEVKLLPHLKLVFSCEPTATAEQVASGMETVRLAFAPFSKAECVALIDQHFRPHTFPGELVDALWRASEGFPAYLATKVFDLVTAGAMFRGATDVWQLAEGGLAAEACVKQFTTDFHEPIERALARLPTAPAGHLQAFLNCAALCGDDVPANLILRTLAMSEEDQEALFDFMDETLLEDGPIPLFRSDEYAHPAFPTQAVYRFLNPLFGSVIRVRLPVQERTRLAAQLLVSQKATLPVRTRGCARLVLEWVRQLEDEAQRLAYETELAWWIGTDEADALTRYLAAAVRQRQVEPEALWALARHTRDRRPAYRRLAVLNALGGKVVALPVAELAAFYADRARLLRQTGRYPEAIDDALSGLDFCDAQSLWRASLNNLIGLAKLALGQYAEALTYSRRALAITEQALGPDHPDTATSLDNLAALYRAQGRYPEAEPLVRRALAITEQALGPDHPTTRTIRDNFLNRFKD